MRKINFMEWRPYHSLTLAENAVNMQVYDVLIIDAALGHIASLKAHGKNITAPAVTHVTIK